MRGRVSFSLSSILWSIPFLFEFKLFGSDFFPDLIGIALLCHGLSDLKKEYIHFKKASLVANIMLLWVFAKYVLSVAWFLKRGISISNELWIAPVLDSITLILLLIIVGIAFKAFIQFNEVTEELASKLTRLGKAYGVYTVVAILVRVINFGFGDYFSHTQWILFSVSIYFIVRMIILVREVYKAVKPDHFQEAVQVYQSMRIRFLSPKATGMLTLVTGIVANLPFVVYLLFFWYTDSIKGSLDLTTGSPLGNTFSYLFIMGSLTSVTLGMFALVISYFTRGKSTLYRPSILCAIFGFAQPFIIMLMVFGRIMLWPGI